MRTILRAGKKRVLVKPLDNQELTTPGGIILAGGEITDSEGNKQYVAGSERPAIGRVIAIPDGYSPVALGELVYYPRFHDRGITHDGEVLLEVYFDELLCAITPEHPNLQNL